MWRLRFRVWELRCPIERFRGPYFGILLCRVSKVLAFRNKLPCQPVLTWVYDDCGDRGAVATAPLGFIMRGDVLSTVIDA